MSMDFTKYGKEMAATEPVPEPHPLGGATAHMKACEYDAGLRVRLIGKDVDGKRVVKEAKSVYGAFMMAEALWSLNTAWHLREDGTRRLLMRR